MDSFNSKNRVGVETDALYRRDDDDSQQEDQEEERRSLLSSSLAHFSSHRRHGGTNNPTDDIENDHRSSPLLMHHHADNEDSSSVSSSVHRRTLQYIRLDSLDHRIHRVGRPAPASRQQPLNSRSSRSSSFDQLQHQAATVTSTINNTICNPERCSLSERSATPDSNTFSCSRATSLFSSWLCPCWNRWLSTYDWSQFASTDLVAGLSVGLLVVPQSLSYAALAGLPVQFGLYAALVPLAAYAVYGTSRQLSVGPVALLSLLLHSGLTGLLQDEEHSSSTTTATMSPEAYQTMYNQLAIQCSLLLGLIYILMGACRLGFVCTMFLSHATVSGFTSGAAMLIASAQIKYLVGYTVTGDRLFAILQSVWINLRHFNPVTFLLGTASIAALLAFKRIDTKTHPQYRWLRPAGPLLVTGTALLLSVALPLLANNNTLRDTIPIVGPIPRGLPNVTLPLLWTPVVSDFKKLLWVVLPMVIIGIMESIAIGT